MTAIHAVEEWLQSATSKVTHIGVGAVESHPHLTHRSAAFAHGPGTPIAEQDL
ncbi:hypothetical protein [Rhodococcus sp. IEGM 1318]|uniref:hypothetical protein n=1 Tax=Rhodococcus sp. IEGM 1318 TaxID=3082226 RepID=UPI0029544524|nr:hypothetical protein [Rhodococcus sp. IEGM 1318]MDV8009151.1 hypothetical protein [Rhodococcus sp. IEGM 1318]